MTKKIKMEELLQSIKTLELDQLCELLRELSSEISSRIDGFNFSSSRIHELCASFHNDMTIYCRQDGMTCAELEDLFCAYGQCWAEHYDGSNLYGIIFENKDDCLRAMNDSDKIKARYNKV